MVELGLKACPQDKYWETLFDAATTQQHAARSSNVRKRGPHTQHNKITESPGSPRHICHAQCPASYEITHLQIISLDYSHTSSAAGHIASSASLIYKVRVWGGEGAVRGGKEQEALEGLKHIQRGNQSPRYSPGTGHACKQPHRSHTHRSTEQGSKAGP